MMANQISGSKKSFRSVLATVRALTTRRLRIASGAVLFIYLSTHFLNHGLGLISIDALESGRQWFLELWRNWPATFLLYGALLTHFGLALYAVYARRRLRMRLGEAVQLLLGLTVPFLLAKHIAGTRGLHELFGLEDYYAYEILVLWVYRPDIGIQQVILFLFAWVHGCMGLHYYLRFRSWYRGAVPYLYGVALLLPTIGLLGFVSAGRAIARLAQDPAWIAALERNANWPDPTKATAFVESFGWVTWITVTGLVVLVLILRTLRSIGERRRGLIRITYADGRTIRVAPGPTLLEISWLHDIPHASVCGGRGRCSTCRVRIGGGQEKLDPPSPAEMQVLKRIGAPPSVRLACQTRPRFDIEVAPLLPPLAGLEAARARPGYLQGQEREVAILFADLRRFTKFAEHKLPYDVVFVLNRYFRTVGTAIERAGGHVDKFIGDGVMALFGVQGDIETASRQALVAARDMARGLAELNRSLAHDLDEPLRIGIGLHVGTVIVGEMGYAHATALTAIGDAVNTASRLEALTKELNGELVVSERLLDRAGLDLANAPKREVEIRGRRDPMAVRVVADAGQLPVGD